IRWLPVRSGRDRQHRDGGPHVSPAARRRGHRDAPGESRDDAGRHLACRRVGQPGAGFACPGRRLPRRQLALTSRTPLPLERIRVLELGNYLAAPTAGRMLADFGADVIKVERPRTGDELRNWRLYAGETSMLYRTVNRNKRSIELDLRTPRG